MITADDIRPGVYLNLPEDVYFSVDALGSSDLKTLYRDPSSWWYGSRHNPDRVEPERERYLNIGSALHALLLEGENAYRGRFCIEPQPSPDLAKTVGDITALLTGAGVEIPNKALKGELVKLAGDNGLGDRVWDYVRGDFLFQQTRGKIPLTAREDRAIRQMAALIELHPEIGESLRGALREVSVFWRDGDVMLRARFDGLTPAWIADIKSISGWQGRTLAHMVARQIVEMDYMLQRAHYEVARREMRGFILEGHVHGADDQQADILREIAARDTWRWVWIFQRVRDDAQKRPKSPIVVPRFHDPVGEAFDMQFERIQQALTNYRSYRDTVGFDTPWMEALPVEEITDEDLAAAGIHYR
ncbi:MAG: hypothetical protein AAFQ84_06100 [Pseudomonadota bacterium]